MRKASALLFARVLAIGTLLALGGARAPALRIVRPAAAATWQRPVEPSAPGPQQLPVDPLLLMASADGTLRDLRLVDRDGREVPYLLVPPSVAEGVWRLGRILPIAATKSESGFELELSRASRTARLRLDGLPEPFLKRYRLEGSGDRRHWALLVPEGTLFGLPDEGLRQLEVSFPEGEYRYLRVTWDDRQSARLPLPKRAAVYLPPSGAPPEASMVDVAFSRRASEPRASRYRLRLPGPGLPVRALVLDVGSGHLLRRARVLEAHLRDGALEPVSLGEGELRRAVRAGAVAAALRVAVARPEEQELELQVDDGDNPPLDLRGVRAELAPQPWIYFESADGAPVTARCGDEHLRAPRYDLEALRDRIASIRTTPARWGNAPAPAPATPSADPAQADPGPGGSIDAAGFRRKRSVPAAAPGLSALLLDADVLAHSDLADLRLVNPAGLQIPYLLERRDEPLVIDLALPPSTARAHVTTHPVDLPARGLPASRLVIETSARVFERRVQVFEESVRAEAGGEPAEHRLAEATWRHADPETAAPALTLEVPQLRSRRVLVRIDEGDNRPLPITSVRLLLPSWRLRFFHPGAPITLLYGRRDLAPPRYDFALLAPRLRAAPAREIPLGPTAATETDASHASMNRVFWVVLVVAVVALLALLARLLGKSGGVAPPPSG